MAHEVEIEQEIHKIQKFQDETLGLKAQLENFLEKTRRDIRSVDWRIEVPDFLTRTHYHVIECQEFYINLQKIYGCQFSQLIEKLDELATANMDLFILLLGARKVFFDEQDRQCFTPSNWGD